MRPFATLIKCITDAFTKAGISYRIGGDEFACILLSASENTVDKCLKELDELVPAETTNG